MCPKPLRAFDCTDTSLSTREILDYYIQRWPIELFLRQAKDRLAFDQYQIRSSQGIRRYWLLISLAHFICCTGAGKRLPFEEGYAHFQKILQREPSIYFYESGVKHQPLQEVLALAG